MKYVILDTGCANIFSIKWALKRLGYRPSISNEINLIKNADKLFLPGVGTAQAAMNQLKKYEIVDILKNYTRPILGICLGMQIMGIKSDENGGVSTIGIILHQVKKLVNDGNPIPHMGWNMVSINKKNPLFKNIENHAYFYFVHSYAMPLNNFTIATCYYGEIFTAAIQKENFFGVQFHPERSGYVGAQLLKNFLEM
ncbi:MAG: imidazole glycerol phosphate synthase subunit HisH [Candidatus Dasytiphilus stammeri]